MNDSATLLWLVIALLIAAVLILTARLRGAAGGTGDRHEGRTLDRLAADIAGLERQRRRADEIIDRMVEGVLLLDESLTPLLANRSARTLLGLAHVGLPARIPSSDVLEIARRALEHEGGAEDDVPLWFPERRTLHVRGTPLADRTGVVVVLQDVTEAVKTQQIRREFVAHASHELKSPVASLHALSEALAEAIRDDPDAALRLANRLGEEADRLGRLIADLLDLSRLEDPVRVPNEEVDLAAVAQREMTSVRSDGEEKGVQILSDLSPAVWVRGDAQQLMLMIRNLLENAVRYTPSGGTVKLTVTRSNGEAVLTVADTGAGIPREAQGRVFERFYRIDRSRSRDRGGTGLGLAIVKHAVELHGGKITLESELDRGSTFTVYLPLVWPRGDDAASRRAVIGGS